MSDEGYQFVPLPRNILRRERPHAVHDRRVPEAMSGTIQLVLQARQPLHVGSGFKGLHEDSKVVRCAAEVCGRPGIPGSTIKGMLRSRYEAITYSCAGAKPKGGKIRSRSCPDIKRASFLPRVVQHQAFESCSPKILCAACALFGCMSMRSRVSATDFAGDQQLSFAIGRMPEQFGPNAHHLGQADVRDGEFKVISLHGRKFAAGQGPVAEDARRQPVKVIPAGSELRGELRFSNVLPEELGGLLTVLGVAPRSTLKLGAGKGYGFGRVVVTRIELRLRDRLESKASDGATAQASLRNAFLRCTDRWDEGEAALVQIHGENC